MCTFASNTYFMKMHLVTKNFVHSLYGFFFFELISIFSFLSAQIPENVYKSDYHISPESVGQLFVCIDNLNFFKDNEFSGSYMKGYTLPGFWFQGKAVYYPLKNLKFEAGVHLLRYWGANKYPNMAYQDIATWQGAQTEKGFHILPVLRAQVALSEHVNIILGTLYGAANHNLIEPLYFPELNLTADPEMGFQLLYASHYVDLDSWVNWQSFMFKDDTHKEAFTVGLSSRLKFNDPKSLFHFYIPIQGLTQHRGGEFDQNYSVETLMNGSFGIGTLWNINHRALKNINLEADMTGYYQQSGELWPFNKGYGLYLRASADISSFRIKTSYWKCHDFISLYGIPYFGAISTKIKDATIEDPSNVYFGFEYSYPLAKGYALGIDMDIYQQFRSTFHEKDDTSLSVGNHTSFSAGIYLRINPSFLIKKF